MIEPNTTLHEGTVAGRPAGAALSDDGLYRYLLWRRLEQFDPERSMIFVMLNPSDANDTRDDNTVRRCIGFCAREARGTLLIVNAFALIAHNPQRLLEATDPVGPLNNGFITSTIAGRESAVIVTAWGAVADHPALRPRIGEVLDLLDKLDVPLHALGDLTAGGYPRHPLYLRLDAPLRDMTAFLSAGTE